MSKAAIRAAIKVDTEEKDTDPGFPIQISDVDEDTRELRKRKPYCKYCGAKKPEDPSLHHVCDAMMHKPPRPEYETDGTRIGHVKDLTKSKPTLLFDDQSGSEFER